MTARRVWSYVDYAGDRASLHVLAAATADAGEPVAQLDAPAVLLTADAARDLRDALNRLLDDDAGAETAQDLHAAHQQLLVRVRRIADQLGEHTTELAEVAGRAREAESAREEVSLEYVAEVMHRLAVQQQRIAASLGDLLSAIAGES